MNCTETARLAPAGTEEPLFASSWAALFQLIRSRVSDRDRIGATGTHATPRGGDPTAR